MDQVEIRIRGEIARDWSESLGGLSITYTGRGETALTGHVRDQAALRGVLNKLADLGLELVSVATGPSGERPRARASREGEARWR